MYSDERQFNWAGTIFLKVSTIFSGYYQFFQKPQISVIDVVPNQKCSFLKKKKRINFFNADLDSTSFEAHLNHKNFSGGSQIIFSFDCNA